MLSLPLFAGFANGGRAGDRGWIAAQRGNQVTHRRWRTTEANKYRARELRRAMTPAEKNLWQHIRYGQLGVQFRKQHAVGPYIVDFFCAKAKLVIEIDGDVHADPEQAKRDAERTEWLNEQKDYRVIRFWNNEVLRDIDRVLETIAKESNAQEVVSDA
jgi:very-short-patch-repair endonuclease